MFGVTINHAMSRRVTIISFLAGYILLLNYGGYYGSHYD
ncbi:putative membrane protein [Escherichia coli MP021561.3]|nr:putative membrane protein [Escherichia coli MP021561.3]